MLKALFKRIKRKVMHSYAVQHVKSCRRLSAQPQLFHATELTNLVRLRMIPSKCALLLDGAFETHWDTRIANQYRLTTQGNSLQELTNDLRRATQLLDTDHAIVRDDIYTTTKEVLLGTYLTQHDGVFTDPYRAMIAFHKASVEFSESLHFYLGRNPEMSQYMLRIMSGYTVSINNVLDDLVELQCDFLSP